MRRLITPLTAMASAQFYAKCPLKALKLAQGLHSTCDFRPFSFSEICHRMAEIQLGYPLTGCEDAAVCRSRKRGYGKGQHLGT